MHSDSAYLLDIIESSEKAVSYISSKTFDQFREDHQCQDAVIRRIEIIGEASSKISKDFQDRHSFIPWKEMKAMRNLLIHEYSDVDIEEVWRTVSIDLPKLLQLLRPLL